MSEASPGGPGAATAVAPPDQASPARPPWRRAGGWPLEAAALLLAPAAAFFGLHVTRMATPRMIDPYFYAAYAQHGRDLIERYGAGNYYWVRLGFILPAMAADRAFGAVAGFYLLRWLFALLAIVPSYLLLRRLRGRAAGALAVAVVLCSPVVLHAWGTNYPDSAVVAYLFAGTACLVMPAASARRRLGWVTAAGLAFALAVHSQMLALPLVAAAVAAHLVVAGRRAPRAAVVQLAVLAACGLAVTAALAGLARALFGTPLDVIGPTIRAARHLRSPQQLPHWHSSTLRWLPYDVYLLVPPLAVAGWCVARLGRRPLAPAEATVALAAALQGVAAVWLQRYGATAVLEFYLYSSMLWPAACLVLALLLAAVCAPLLARPATAAAPAVLVVAATLAVAAVQRRVSLEMAPAGLLLVAGLLAVVALARRLRGQPVAAAAAALLAAGCVALSVGRPRGVPLQPGQAKFPQARYDLVLLGDGRAELDGFRLASKLRLLVPPARSAGDDLMLWYPPGQSQQVNQTAAQYLWHVNSLRETMPALRPVDRKRLLARRPRLLVLLSATGAEFPAALQSLRAASLQPTVLREQVLTGGPQRLAVAVVELGRFATPPA